MYTSKSCSSLYVQINIKGSIALYPSSPDIKVDGGIRPVDRLDAITVFDRVEMDVINVGL
ncbi:hypothetical protein D3C77_509330 [compost metagenome]